MPWARRAPPTQLCPGTGEGRTGAREAPFRLESRERVFTAARSAAVRLPAVGF